MKDKTNIFVFIAFLCVFFAFVTVLEPDARVAESENRNPNPLPSLSLDNVFDGGFAAAMEAYLTDRVGFRTDIIAFSRLLTDAGGLPPDDGVKIVVVNDFTDDDDDYDWEGLLTANDAPAPASPQPAPTPEPPAQPTPEPTPAPTNGTRGGYDDFDVTPPARPHRTPHPAEPTPPPEIATVGEPMVVGVLITFPDRLVEIFGYNESRSTRYAQMINLFREALPPEKCRVFSAIAPTSVEFLPERYRSASHSEKLAIDNVNAHLAEGVIPVDFYSALQSHADEYIYFRTDHHWTALGSYYAYRKFAEAAGFAPLPLEDYEEISLEGFLGYLYQIAPSKTLSEQPDTITYYVYKGELETSSPLHVRWGDSVTYSLFIGGDRAVYEFTTSNKNGRTAVIVKDSFGNCFVPWLAPHYERVIVIDPRHYKNSLTAMLGQYDDIDLIFLNYAFMTTSNGYIEMLSNIK